MFKVQDPEKSRRNRRGKWSFLQFSCVWRYFWIRQNKQQWTFTKCSFSDWFSLSLITPDSPPRFLSALPFFLALPSSFSNLCGLESCPLHLLQIFPHEHISPTAIGSRCLLTAPSLFTQFFTFPFVLQWALFQELFRTKRKGGTEGCVCMCVCTLGQGGGGAET